MQFKDSRHQFMLSNQVLNWSIVKDSQSNLNKLEQLNQSQHTDVNMTTSKNDTERAVHNNVMQFLNFAPIEIKKCEDTVTRLEELAHPNRAQKILLDTQLNAVLFEPKRKEHAIDNCKANIVKIREFMRELPKIKAGINVEIEELRGSTHSLSNYIIHSDRTIKKATEKANDPIFDRNEDILPTNPDASTMRLPTNPDLRESQLK